jgi:hypothetical protein
VKLAKLLKRDRPSPDRDRPILENVDEQKAKEQEKQKAFEDQGKLKDAAIRDNPLI